MKRLKRSKLKVTVLDSRGRKTKKFIPLTVPNNYRRPSINLNQAESNSTTSSEQMESSCDEFRKTNRFVNWQNVSGQLFTSYVESSAMPDNPKCVVCAERNEETTATVRCLECGSGQIFCRDCASKLHYNRNQFHVLDLWQKNKYIPFYPDHGTIGHGHDCETKIKRPFTLVDFYGRHHAKYVEVCSCESSAATLVRLNFWPGSPEKPTVAFHMDLMRLCEKISLQCQVSLFNIVEVLNTLRSPLHPTLVLSIYSILNSGCFEEFRQFQYQCRFLGLAKQIPELDNGSICPLCPEDNGTLIESMDACIGLVRKRSKGIKQRGQMRHSSLFFSDQEDVDSFVDNYSSEPNEIEKDCNRFHAGEVLSSMRSKGKNKIFEEKGVFGRVCRHDYPKGFLDLKYGERISYSVYELKKLNSLVDGKKLSLILMYDIACILDKHIQGTNQENLLDGVGLAIPTFHCYGHEASCQVKYSPRRIQGVGLTDGEGVERLWSFLRNFAKMTKEMAADKRTDVLTDALLYYGEKLRGKFGVSLKRKLSRAETLLKDTEARMKELSKSIPEPCSTQHIKEWQSAELDFITPKEKVLELDWQEKYVDLLLDNNILSTSMVYATSNTDPDNLENLQKRKKRNEKALVGVEKKRHIHSRWKEEDTLFQTVKERLLNKKKESVKLRMHRMASERLFLLEMKKKYADGQTIAIKLAKNITRATDQLKKNMKIYNGLGGRLTFDDIKDPCSALYCTCGSTTVTAVPTSTKKQLVDLLCLRERCEEEIDLLKKEMIQLQSFYLHQINVINQIINSLSETAIDLGLKAILFAKQLALQSAGGHLQVLWKDLNVSPYHWEAMSTWATMSTAPVPLNVDETDTDDSDIGDEQESDNEDGVFTESDNYEDVYTDNED